MTTRGARISRSGRFFLLGVTLFLLGGCQASESETSPTVNADAKGQSQSSAKVRAPRPENAAPDFLLSDIAGNPVRFTQFEGRVVMVDFWATWCGPCRRTIPDLIALYNTYNDSGFDVIGIALEKRRIEDGLILYVEKMKIPYPILIGSREVVAAYGGIKSIPTAFLIGRDGTIRERLIGVQPRATLEKAIRELLAEPPPDAG